jgi:hypothetical protein
MTRQLTTTCAWVTTLASAAAAAAAHATPAPATPIAGNLLPKSVATLRRCDGIGDPGQGWHLEQGFILSNGRNGNNSAPNWKLPDCGWCLTVDKSSDRMVEDSSRRAANTVRKAHCCARGTCLHHPFPSVMCTNASSIVAARFQVLSDGRLVLAVSGKCIGTTNHTPGMAIGELECNQKGEFIVWRPGEQPSLRAATASTNLCLGTGVASGTQKLFHCSGDRCVPGGDSHVSYQDPNCFSQCNASLAALGA